MDNLGETNNLKDNDLSGGSTSNKALIIFLVVLFIGALAAAVFFYQRSQAVAIVNGERIAKDELYQAMLSYYGDDILEEMINKKLILQEGKRLEITVSEEEVNEEVDKIIEQFSSEEEFYQTLEEYGDTKEDLIERIEVDKLLRKIAMNDLEVEDEEIEAFFVANRMWFDVPEEIRLSHILVNTDAEADEVIRRLEQGEDFAALAGELSIDTFTKDEGGDLGFLQRGEMAYEFDEEFEDVAFSLDIGEYSVPLETYRGIHIINVIEINEGREVTFQEVRDDVEYEFMNEMIGPKIQELLERLRKEADIDKYI